MLPASHFRSGVSGKLGQLFLSLRNKKETLEETLTIPFVISVVAYGLMLKEIIGVDSGFMIFFASSIFAGAWFGAVRGQEAILRGLLRGLLLGIMTAAGIYAISDESYDRKVWASYIGNIIYVQMYIFWFGHMIVGSVNSILTITEEQWQFGASTRVWMKTVFQIVLGAKSLESASMSQIILVLLLRLFIGVLTIWATGQTVFGIDADTAWSAIKHLMVPKL